VWIVQILAFLASRRDGKAQSGHPSTRGARAVMPGEQPRPPITPEMRRRALTMPNNWLHVVDPDGDVSRSEAVLGRYLVDAQGQITDQYVPNPRYRPVGNDLETTMRLLAAGQTGNEDLLVAVLAAELILPADPTRPPRQHVVFRKGADGQVIDVFASSRALPHDWPPHWHRFTGVELAVLLDRLGEPVRLHLYGSPELQFAIEGEVLVDALRGAVAG
jgi:hypothetical protein